MNLTNELGFSFWLECYPNDYAVRKKEFALVLKDWFSTYKNINMTKEMA
jgi:hypothetical protein